MAWTGSLRRVDLQAEINITPLIDVMLALLAIFMIAAPVVTRQIDLPLAGSAAPPPAIEPPLLTLSIMGAGEWYLDGVSVTRAGLADRLRTRIASAPAAPVVELRAQPTSAYDDVASALAVARASGVTQLRIATPER
ncbi:MAG TPA: biopolymer transporter ExbD [Dokdonella sp.]|uniref:ExbD/TolR family protein n=1 Tax=Dokdonella sp. TaxID=2291710 RepID=UPI002C5C0E86|nr:biopolymer transporter ExbD [Dokdonella sp.]HUD41903.1 biopolymer transporter ExbD [Dokdonella sp.]